MICPKCGHDLDGERDYQNSVRYVREVIPKRGRIWEGARPAFESGEYSDESLARMLREGVIVPAKSPKGGYVLPS